MAKKLLWILTPVIIISFVLGGYMFYNGVADRTIRPNDFFSQFYPVKGIDISHHQGRIDWEQLMAGINVDFVFIKATEGSDFSDTTFEYNWAEAAKYNVRRGAYHYFSTASDGYSQARHFIETVPDVEGGLPPAVDLEELDLTVDEFDREFQALLDELERHYGKPPIIYCVYSTYYKYLDGKYTDYPLWFRDVAIMPHYNLFRPWTFWQYSHDASVPGVGHIIDLNVFAGTPEQLEDICK